MSMIAAPCIASSAQIQDVLRAPEHVKALIEQEQKNCTDLDKAWHGIHFMLTGEPWGGKGPLAYLLGGGAKIGDVDLGYGPGYALSAEQTADFDDALSKVSVEDFRKKYAPKAMAERQIYPAIWDEKYASEDPLGFLVNYFERLKQYVSLARSKHDGLIIYIF